MTKNWHFQFSLLTLLFQNSISLPTPEISVHAKVFKMNKKIDISINSKWLSNITLLKRIFEFELVLIVKHESSVIEIVGATKNEKYKTGNIIPLGSPFVDVFWLQKQRLFIDDLNNDSWKGTFIGQTGYSAYLGVPLLYPNEVCYGTLCVFDKSAAKFSENAQDMILLCKDNIEQHLKSVFEKEIEDMKVKRNTEIIGSNILSDFKRENIFSSTAEVLFFNNDDVCVNQFSRKKRTSNKLEKKDKHISDIFPKNIADKIIKNNSPLLLTNEIAFADFSIITDSAEKTYRALFFRHDQNGYTVVLRDVTNRKNRENRFNVLSSIIHNLKSGVLFLSFDGIIEFVNKKYCDITGYEIGELIGQDAKLFKSGTHPAFFYKKMEQTIGLGEVWNGEINVKKKNGSPLWLDVTVIPFLDKMKVQQIIAICRNITELKDMAEELAEATSKIANTKNIHDAFFSNVSHEIRTPVNSIVGFADLLKLDNLPREKVEEFVSYIQKNSTLLLGLIDEIVDLSRIEAGNISIKKAKTRINELMDDTYSFFDAQIKNEKTKNIVLKLHNEIKDKLFAIKTDGQRLRQILVNLISNALKFTNRGVIDFGYKIETGTGIFIHFFVRDTGTGIPKNKIDLIFDRFGQIEKPYKRNIRGMGLGLPITKQLVEILGGELWVESKASEGTTFHFTIPYNISFNENDAPATKSSGRNENVTVKNKIYNWENKTILLVEDEKKNQTLYQFVLQQTKVKLLIAENGVECLKMCEENLKKPSIDLILMDIRMPIMDGIETTKRLVDIYKTEGRQNKKFIAPPIIAQTAYTRDYEKAKSLKAGCVDFITKPIKGNELLLTVSKYI